MSKTKAGELFVALGLDTARLKSDTGKASAHFNSMEKRAGRSLGKIKRGVGGLASKMQALTGLAGVLSVAGLGAVAKASIAADDKIQKLSLRIGASTEALSEYQHVAELSGVRFDSLTMAWQRMTRRVSEAAIGTGEAKGALAELNIDAAALSRLAPEDQFEAIADRLSGVGNQADKVRLAMKLFDSEGVSVLQMMDKGADGMREMREQARALGLTLTQENANGAAAAADAMTRLAATGKVLGQTLARTLGPVIADVSNWLAVNIPGAVQFAGDSFRSLQAFTAKIVVGLAQTLGKVYGVLGKLPGNLGVQYQRAQANIDGFALHMANSIDKVKIATGANREFTTSMKEVNVALNPANTGEATSGGAGTGTTTDDKLVRSLNSLTESLKAEEERLRDSLGRRTEIAEAAEAAGMISKTRLWEIELQLADQFQRDLTALTVRGYTERQQFVAMSAARQTATVLGEVETITRGVARENKALFKINKIAGAANAGINAYEGASRTLAKYPWPLAGGLAALHLAAGFAQVRAINATSFGGGGGAPSLAASGGTPANPVPQNDAHAPGTAGNGNTPQTLIVIQGNYVGDPDQLDELVQTASLRVTGRDGEMIAPTSRNALDIISAARAV